MGRQIWNVQEMPGKSAKDSNNEHFYTNKHRGEDNH